MARKKRLKKTVWNSISSSDFEWAIKNNWQIYIKPYGSERCKIATRYGGISSEGRDYFYDSNGSVHKSTELPGGKIYDTQEEAQEALPEVYRKIRNKYEN